MTNISINCYSLSVFFIVVFLLDQFRCDKILLLMDYLKLIMVKAWMMRSQALPSP